MQLKSIAVQNDKYVANIIWYGHYIISSSQYKGNKLATQKFEVINSCGILSLLATGYSYLHI